MAAKEIRILVPAQIYDALRRVEERTGVKMEDLIMRALVKVIEEFGGG
ncbi:MAG: hypothetical protein QXI05_05615 [Candidatus Bathyarchaeia archaeon]